MVSELIFLTVLTVSLEFQLFVEQIYNNPLRSFMGGIGAEWVRWGKVGRSDEIFIDGVKARKFKITGTSILLIPFQWENKNDCHITLGFLAYGLKLKMSTDRPVLPHLTHFPPNPPRSINLIFIDLCMHDLLSLELDNLGLGWHRPAYWKLVITKF